MIADLPMVSCTASEPRFYEVVVAMCTSCEPRVSYLVVNSSRATEATLCDIVVASISTIRPASLIETVISWWSLILKRLVFLYVK